MGEILEVGSTKIDSEDENICMKTAENKIPEPNTTVSSNSSFPVQNVNWLKSARLVSVRTTEYSQKA